MTHKTILIYYEQRDYGGVDTHLSHLINHWPGQEDRLVVVSNRDNKGIEFLKTKLRRPNVEIKLLNLDPGPGWGRLPRGLHFLTLRLLAFIFFFHHLLQSLKPEVLLADNGGYPGGLTCYLAVIVGRLLHPRVRSVLLVHHAPTPGRLALRAYAQVLSWATVHLDIPLVTVSQASKEALEGGAPLKPFSVIYNGIEPLQGTETRLDLRSRYRIPESRTLMGIIGPLDPHKGHAVLLEAIARSRLLQEKACLLIVGKGPCHFAQSLKNGIKGVLSAEMIIFTGFLPEDSFAIIREFDVLVMPSTVFEGFGYSMAEGMALGVPVVASRVGAIPEVVQDGRTGLLVAPGDAEQLQRALERLVMDHSLCRFLGMNGQKHILTHFSAQKMAEEYYRLLFGNNLIKDISVRLSPS